MVTTRQIDDKEFLQLVSLNYKYHQSIPSKLNMYKSTSLLVLELVKSEAIATGVFKNSKLVGFTLGYKLGDSLFHFTAMYILPRYRRYATLLYKASEQPLKGKYSAWVLEAVTSQGLNLIKRLGAKVVKVNKKSISLYKEI